MKRATLVSLLLLLFPAWLLAQGVSCPAVVAGPDTTIGCGTCVRLDANPVSGFTTTDYQVQQIPYSPYPYNAGTPILVNIDDIWSNVLPIGFNFCFYGNTYNQCLVGSNGVVSFDLTNAGGYCAWPINQAIPGNMDVLNSVLGPFHDIDPSVGGSIYWTMYGQAPCRVFVVSFYNIPMFSCNNVIATQQIALYETTNIIEVYIQNRPSCATWNGDAAIEGIQNANGTQAVVVGNRNFPTAWTAANDAYAFVPDGTPNYTVQWFELGNPTPLTNLDTITVCPAVPTDYVAEVVYTNCDGATVTVHDTANIDVCCILLTTTHVDNICNGGTTGTATVSATGSTNPLSYAWSNGQSTPTATGLAAGNYTVSVTEQGGCTVVTSVVIGQPLPIVLQATHQDALCNGQSSGTATVTATNAVGNISYNWSNGGTTQTITGLAAGTYSVTVTDANGCTATTSTTVGQPVPVQISVSGINPTCPGQPTGSATAVASQGVGTYSYLWSNGANTATATGLVAGTYSVTATDANGCQASGSVTLVDPPVLSVTATNTNVTCFGGDDATATASGSGGTPPYLFVWSNGMSGSSIAGLAAGSYTVTVTDANLCTSTTSITVTEPAIIGLQITGDSTLCEYDSVRLSAVVTGGVAPYLYYWRSIPSAVSDSSADLVYVGGETRTYVLTITDQNGCSVTTTRQVISYDAPIVAFYPDRDEACDSVTIRFTNITNPSDCSFLWTFSDGTTSAYPDPEHFFGNGIWSVGLTATSNEGCVASTFSQDLITVLPTPQASFSSDPNITLLDYRLLSEASFMFNNTSPWYATSVDWSFGNGDSAFVGQVQYTYQDTGYFCITMTAYNDFGCHTDSTQCIHIRQDPFLWVPTGFTPNGDGVNDLFLLGGIEIATFKIEIFDRWGRLIYTGDDMTTGWDGKVMTEDAPEGAYVFKVQATTKLGQKTTRAGTVTLIR